MLAASDALLDEPMFGRGRLLDGYILRQTIGTLAAVIAIVISLMVLEHLPRLIDISRVSGHRGYIVSQTIIGLVPEYLGIGMLFGLYLATALTVRRLALRGELEAIESSGVGPWRWMRMPRVLTMLIAGLILVNQGWIMPAGESRLAQIGHRIAIGDFGYNIEAGEFIELGSGNILTFRGVETDSGYLTKLFLRTADQTYTAAKGRLSITPDRGLVVELIDGQVLGHADGRRLGFKKILYHIHKRGVSGGSGERQADPSRLLPLDELLSSKRRRDRSVAYGRMLWPLLALLAPILSFVLGNPAKRGRSGIGVFVGLVLLVTLIKAIALLSDGDPGYPGVLALGIVVGWCIVVSLLLALNRRLGRGFVDQWVGHLTLKARSNRGTEAQAGI